MSKSEALLLAEAFVHGAKGIPESTVFDGHAAHLLMCRAVIAQAEELAKLRTALDEALSQWSQWGDCADDNDSYDRIAELRELLR